MPCRFVVFDVRIECAIVFAPFVPFCQKPTDIVAQCLLQIRIWFRHGQRYWQVLGRRG